MYTIGQVSEMSGIPISTLRYYDKEGLFPNMQRVSGVRQFGDDELEALRVIDCLKKSGLQIKEIRQFMDWCKEGKRTYKKRLALLENQKEKVEEEIGQLNKSLDMINYKCWYYGQAIEDGNENRVRNPSPEIMPKEIWESYQRAHSDESN